MTRLRATILILLGCVITVSFTAHNMSSAAAPGINQLVSVDSSGNQGNGVSSINSISSDGRYVAFYSAASNLVANDTNGVQDIFLRDSTSNTTTRVSVSSSGGQANAISQDPFISYDGRYVVFTSNASNLVAADTTTSEDVYIHDRSTGTTSLVSVGTHGYAGNGASRYGKVSADGRFVVFESKASDLVSSGGNNYTNIYVRDLINSTMQLISKNSSGNAPEAASLNPSISCDGAIISFVTHASNLVPNDTNNTYDIIVANRTGGSDVLTNITIQGNKISESAAVSCDGNYVVFDSHANNLVPDDDTSQYGRKDIFRYSRIDKSIKLISRSNSGVKGDFDSYFPSVSGDGRYVSYESDATNLVSNDTNNTRDVFITDNQTGTTERISVGSSLAQANNASYSTQISANEKYVTYTSYASNLVLNDTNGAGDVFLSQTGY